MAPLSLLETMQWPSMSAIETQGEQRQQQQRQPPSETKNETKTTPILVEIIGATNLNHPFKTEKPNYLQPFVLAKLHNKSETQILTRTKRIKNTCDPIWCVEHRCLFVLNLSMDMIQKGEGDTTPCTIEFDVRHKDSMDPLSCTQLGSSTMDMETLMKNCTQERIEMTLVSDAAGTGTTGTNSAINTHDANDTNDASNANDTNDTNNAKEEEEQSEIAVRFRLASELDLQLMGELAVMQEKGQYSSFQFDDHKFINEHDDNSQEKTETEDLKKKVEFITERNQSSVGYNGVVNMLTSVAFRNSKTDKDGVVQWKVKPYPDPKRIEQTIYLSNDELVTEMMKPSSNWIAAGKETSQSLGKVHLEILRCTDLPNMDAGEAIGNLTDAFACAIFEESMVQTEIIDDKLNPFWLPWTQRAFVFQMTHAFSPLYISVNDFDLGIGGHEGIGRIAINLSHFQPDTMYTLTYNLYPAANIPEREALGSITIRLRKEITDEKKLMMSSLKPTPRFHVNMQKKMSLPVANFTCFGAHNEDTYDIKLLRSYVNEILELKRFIGYVLKDTFTSLIMWHGQLQVGDFHIPIHSIIAFFGGIYVIERPHLLPGCFFLCIAWIMLASLNSRIHHPSPWHRTLPFTHYLSILIFGKSCLTVDEIKSMQCHNETSKHEKNWENRFVTDTEAINKRWNLHLEMEKIGNEDLRTEEEKKSADPIAIALASLAPRLFPIQKRLRVYCNLLRYIKKVTTWEEGMISFWVTLPCIIIGIVLLILPTVFLIHWICRLLIWVCLGPWLRMYYEFFVIEHDKPLSLDSSSESMSKYANDTFQKITEQFKEIERVARLKGEEAIKMKSMRQLRFGRYIAKVPPMNVTRHYDFPLSNSMSSHISSLPEGHLKEDLQMKVVPSQRLEGQMIPMTEEQLVVYIRNSERLGLVGSRSAESNVSEIDQNTSGIASEPTTPAKNTIEEAREWMDNAFGSLSFKSRTRIALPMKKPQQNHLSSVSEDSIEVSDNIQISDSVLHIATDLLERVDENVGSGSYESNALTFDQSQDDCEEEAVEIVAWDTNVIEECTLHVPSEIRDEINETRTDTSDVSQSTEYHSTQGVYVTFCRSPSARSTGSISTSNH